MYKTDILEAGSRITMDNTELTKVIVIKFSDECAVNTSQAVHYGYDNQCLIRCK